MIKESDRIKTELAGLGSEFAKNGIVRTILRDRIEQEQVREGLLAEESKDGQETQTG